MCEIGQTDIKEWCISASIDTLIKSDAIMTFIDKTLFHAYFTPLNITV